MLRRLIDRPLFKVGFEFEPRDVWVGLFWRRTDYWLHFYVCMLPCVPLHVVVGNARLKDAYQRGGVEAVAAKALWPVVVLLLIAFLAVLVIGWQVGEWALARFP
jgi:hypothetical protein